MPTANASQTYPRYIHLLRTIPNAVNDYVEIGNFTSPFGSHCIRFKIKSDINAAWSIAQIFEITSSYNYGAGAWWKVSPLRQTYTGTHKINLECSIVNNVSYFRLVNMAGTGSGQIVVIQIEFPSSDEYVFGSAPTFSETTGTGTITPAVALMGGGAYGGIFRNNGGYTLTAVPSSTWTQIFTAAGTNTTAEGTTPDAATNYQVTLDTPGAYLIGGSASVNGVNCVGLVRIGVSFNGGTPSARQNSQITGGYNGYLQMSASCVIGVSAGDILTLVIWHNTGTAQNIDVGFPSLFATQVNRWSS